MPADAMLVHEMLGHSWQKQQGLWSVNVDPNWNPTQIKNFSDDRWAPTSAGWIGNRFTERDATSIENRYRKANSIQPRLYYPGPAYDPKEPDVWLGTGTKFFMYLYPAGNELFLKTQTSHE